MNKTKIINNLKELSAEVCSNCLDNEDYLLCSTCKRHKLINEILEELNGG